MRTIIRVSSRVTRNGPRNRIVSIMLCVFGAVSPGVVHSQGATVIKTDASWGRTPAAIAPAASAVLVSGNNGSYNVPGNVYVVPQSVGKAAGPNLFHSFQAFSVGSGDAALFTTTSNFNNVISRVSGASATTINGLLALLPAAGTQPNFFFINPNGIAFGAGAQVDVPAGFHVSTANHLRFADGILFKAGAGADSTLSIAPPVAFGFLGSTRSAVEVRDGVFLETVPGAPLSVIAGDINLDGGLVATFGGGELRLAALGSDPLDVSLNGPLPVMHGNLLIANGGGIVSATLGTQRGANIAVSAGDITIDARGINAFTGITSLTLPNTVGNAGDITISAANDLWLGGGAVILSESYTGSNTGSIAVTASRMTLNGRDSPLAVDVMGNFVQTGICTCVIGTPGVAGGVALHATDYIAILEGAEVYSFNGRNAKAGAITMSAPGIVVNGRGSFFSTGVTGIASDAGAGSDVQVRTGQLVILDGGEIRTVSNATGQAGVVDVEAQSIEIDRLANPQLTGIDSTANSRGNAGDIRVRAPGGVSISRGGKITTRTFSAGNAGSIEFTAGSLVLDGGLTDIPTGLTTQANEKSSGNAGQMNVRIQGALRIGDAGIISAQTFGTGDAGSVSVDADSIAVNGGASQGSQRFSGISTASVGPAGNAGPLQVSVNGALTLLDGGQIASSTAGTGNGGSIKITAGSFDIAGTPAARSGIFASAFPNSSGHAGDVDVQVRGNLRIADEGVVVTSTVSSGNAGAITISAQNINLEAASHLAAIFSSTTGAGHAGNIDVTARQSVSIDAGAFISAGTGGTGNAGSIQVTAHDIHIDGRDRLVANAIQAVSQGQNAGNAGDIRIHADGVLSVVRGGVISASTSSAVGRSGSVIVNAGTVVVDGDSTGIEASADVGSSGRTGNLAISAGQAIQILNGGTLSIRNDGHASNPSELSPTLLSVSAPSIVLRNANITAESTDNVSASEIRVSFIERLIVDPSEITTSAKNANGGPINIAGSGVMILDHSHVTTSVEGEGNGGNITIRAGSLILDTGAIQANTRGEGARGGDIAINVQTLVASGSTVFIGGAPVSFAPDVFGLNIIQAAAPNGVSGTIDLTTPVTDIAGSLHRLSTEVVSFGALAKDLCRVGASSSLTPLGRGGLRPTSAGLIRPEGRSVGQGSPENADGGHQIRLAREDDAQRALYRCQY